MTLDEILPLLLIFNTIISVSTLCYVIGISTDIDRNRRSLETMLSIIYQSLLSRVDEILSKKERSEE